MAEHEPAMLGARPSAGLAAEMLMSHLGSDDYLLVS